MVIKTSEELRELSIMIFKKAGVVDSAAKRITEHLVNSNLVGMDSHGVIRIPDYIQWIKEGIIDLKAQMKIINETFIITVIDGHFSFGQVVMYKACEIAIMKAKEYGISLTTIRNVSHIGRLGEYAEKIANERMVCMIAVNGQGAGQYVAPYGGISRRLSVNPMAWGIPTGIKEKPLVLDISTTIVSEGKIKTKINKGESIPKGWVIDSDGKQTANPKDLYGPPEGSLLPFGKHKGFGLSMIVDILAGGLSGGGCSRPGVKKFYNSICVVAINPQIVQATGFIESVDNLISYVKSSEPIKGFNEILVPNEIEWHTREKRLNEGIEIDDNTWNLIVKTAKDLGVHLKKNL